MVPINDNVPLMDKIILHDRDYYVIKFLFKHRLVAENENNYKGGKWRL